MKLSRFWYVRGYLDGGERRLEAVLARPRRADARPASPRVHGCGVACTPPGRLRGGEAFAEEHWRPPESSGESATLRTLTAIWVRSCSRRETPCGQRVCSRRPSVSRARRVTTGWLRSRSTTSEISRSPSATTREQLRCSRRASPCFGSAGRRGEHRALALQPRRGRPHGVVGSGDAERFRESLALSRETGDHEDIAWSLLGLAATCVDAGDARRGAVLLGAARSVLTQMNADFKPFERQLDRRTEDQVSRASGRRAARCRRLGGGIDDTRRGRRSRRDLAGVVVRAVSRSRARGLAGRYGPIVTTIFAAAPAA